MALSTLERILDSIKKRDDETAEHLPALPQRPTSRGRPPSRSRSSELFSDHRTQHRSSHATDASSHYNSENGHQKHAHYGDGCSPAFENDLRKESKREGRFAQDNEHAKATEPCSNVCSSAENGGLPRAELIPKKQGPAPSYVSLKRRRRDRQRHGLQKGSQVWIMSKNNTWVLGNVRSISDLDSAVVCAANDKLLEIPFDKLLPVNPEFLDGVGDLVHLTYIHEPAVFHVLQQRYKLGMFCTSAGSSCIVLPPPKEYPQICSLTDNQSLLKEPKPKTLDSKWSPVHSIADRAHNSLIKDWKDQSIIIGGETCAGKMESAEVVLGRLVSLGNNEEIANALLNCNVILEAFGNARIANGVSASQNGKLIEVNFDRRGKICSGRIQILLLEKSRVVYQAEKEPSFHIFYQLCELADISMREKLNLMDATKFNYLNCRSSINGIHPFSDFQSLLNAFDALGFTKESQHCIFSMLGAILWLGNISSAATINNEAVDNAANLLHCSTKDLLEAISAGGHDFADISAARDVLACAIYERLFNWLVAQINKVLTPKTVSELKSITIVDMPSFRSSENAGFESLLVNYAQDHLHLFTRRRLLQQGEEVANCEGLGSCTVDPAGNDEKIGFLEYDLLPLLMNLEDDAFGELSESVLLSNIEKLLAERKQLHNGTFKVAHISGEATYSVVSLLKDMKDLFYLHNSQRLQSWIDKLVEPAACRKKESIPQLSSEELFWKQSCFSNCQKQVLQMIHHLEDTEPHFIFCVSPSISSLTPNLEQGHVIQQLRINGVIESVRFLRSGYVLSIPVVQFASRFGLLLGTDMKEVHGPLGISVAVLQLLQVPSYMYQMGWAQIFLCLELVERLENVRGKLLNGVVSVQKTFRGFRVRKKLEEQKLAVVSLQAFVRGWLVRKGFLNKDKSEIKSFLDQNYGGKHKKLDNSVKVLGSLQAKDSFPEYLKGEKGTHAQLALKKKDEEIAVLQQNLKEYERKWIAYEAKMKSMEEMWQKQVTHLEQRLNVATKGSCTEESAYKTGESDKAVVISTPQNESTRDTLETASGEPDLAVLKNEHDPSRPVLDKLSKELEHRTQVFNDDAKFLVEVKSGQITANFKPDAELQKLQQRFEVWKKDYKGRLKETKGILKKLGKSGNNNKSRKRWWSRK